MSVANKEKQSPQTLSVFQSEHARSLYRLALAVEYATFQQKKQKNISKDLKLEAAMNQAIAFVWSEFKLNFGEGAMAMDLDVRTEKKDNA